MQHLSYYVWAPCSPRGLISMKGTSEAIESRPTDRRSVQENRFNPFMGDQIFGVANRKYYSDQSLFICTHHIKVLASEAIV
ncbi:MAG: hypothetical protein H7Y39_02910 [Nitrospiraceae bacterium]|nr:hypothetical protein [Nitrospiraceae bacterium]